MSIEFNGLKTIATGSSPFWQAQANASLFCLMKFGAYDTGLASSGIIRHTLSALSMSANASTVNPGGIKLSCTVFNNGGSQVINSVELLPDIVYAIGVTFTSGLQQLWANGSPKTIGNLTGTTKNNSDAVTVGSQVATAFQWFLSNLCGWNGYLLTASDMAALRDGADPSTIGGGATQRFRWTYSGTDGVTVATGSTGLADSYGGSNQNFTVSTGQAGTAVYRPDLVFVPTAVVTEAYVTTSGEMVGMAFESAIHPGVAAHPISSTTMPTITINGGASMPLIEPYEPGSQERWLAKVPVGVVIQSTNVVQISYPSGWLLTDIGITAGATGRVLDNRAGKPINWRALRKPKRGTAWNIGGSLAANWSSSILLRGKHYSMSNPATVTAWDENLMPTAISASPCDFTVRSTVSVNYIDSTGEPLQTGIWVVGWNNPNVATRPTAFTMYGSNNLTVQEVTTLSNSGSGGLGLVKAYNVQYVPGATTLNANLILRMTCPGLQPDFDGLVVYGPGDFQYTPGVPIVLQKTSQLSWPLLLDRLPYGVESLRWMDSTIGTGGYINDVEVGDVKMGPDFSYGTGFNRERPIVRCVQARSWDDAVSPYYYSDLEVGASGMVGEPYAATLAVGIDATTTVLTITDAATAPVLAGLQLLMDGERMRVTDVAGTAVTVDRGWLGTTAAVHSAGPIQVLYRFAISFAQMGANFRAVEFVTQDPHKIRSFTDKPYSGNFPQMSFADGGAETISNYRSHKLVTGANTFLDVRNTGKTAPPMTIASTVTLNPTTNYIDYSAPVASGIAVEAACQVTAAFANCDLHINFPLGGTDAMFIQWIKKILDNFPRGRLITFEMSNEPWNGGFDTFGILWIVNQFAYGKATFVDWIVHRYGYLQNLLEQVAGDRFADFRFVWNTQQGSSGTVDAVTAICAANGYRLDSIAVAPYLEMDSAVPLNLTYPWRATTTDGQAMDIYVHTVLYSVKTFTSYRYMQQSIRTAIANAKANYGMDLKLIGYEGGPDQALALYTATLKASIGPTDMTLTLSKTDGFQSGQYLKLNEGEWVIVDTVTSSTQLTLSARGANGTTPTSWPADSTVVRTANIERSADLFYNPLFRHAMKDIYWFFENEGFDPINLYCLALNSYQAFRWGAYVQEAQGPGRGDGLDGLYVNNTYLNQPGKPNTKSATQNLDRDSVSVRGLAAIEHQHAANQAKKKRKKIPGLR